MKQIPALLVIFLITSVVLRAQTITIDSVSSPATCDSAQITIYYTATGTFGAKNVFTVQLSDDSIFTSFSNAGSLKSTSSGSISIVVPKGNYYRVRVSSSNPYLVSSDNGSDIVVSSSPASTFYVWRDTAWAGGYPMSAAGLEGDTIAFASGAGTYWYSSLSFAWDFGSDATPTTSTDPIARVTYSTLGSKQVSLTVTNSAGCSRTSTLAAVSIYECNPSIPANVIIDSTAMDFSLDSAPLRTPVWVVPGASLTLPYASACSVYAEAGSTVNGGYAMGDTIYMKAGATFTEYAAGNAGNPTDQVVIYAPGASVKARYLTTVLECNSLGFDYSDAPPYKIIPAPAGVIPDAQSDPGFSIYPNPATNLVNIESKEIPQSISVRNELGEEILSDNGPLATSRIEFDVSRFANGVYYVDLGLNGKMETLKFTVAR